MTRALRYLFATAATALTGILLTLAGPAIGIATAAPAPAPSPAAPGQPVADPIRVAWENHGRPTRMVIVRTGSVDSVLGGVLTRKQPRPTGPMSTAELAAAAPAGWISVGPQAVRVASLIVLSPGVDLTLDGAPTIALTGGAVPADAASIHVGGGRLIVRGATVTSADLVSGVPLPPGPGRPIVKVGTGGQLIAADATFHDLGTPETSAVELSTGSSGTLERTTLRHNSFGLRIGGAKGVRLIGVTITDSAADGLVLNGDTGTVLTDVRVERSAGDGVRVDGPSTERPITGVTTAGNGKFGLRINGQQKLRVVGGTSRGDRLGGIHLLGSTDTTITGYSTADAQIGVFITRESHRAVVEDLRSTGGDRAVVVEQTVDGATIRASRIAGATTGMVLGGHHIAVQDVQIDQARSGIRIERGAAGVIAERVRITGGTNGVVVIRTTRDVLLRDLQLERIADAGVRTAGPGVQIVGGHIDGGGTGTGIVTDAATSIDGTRIENVRMGLSARTAGPVTAHALVVSGAVAGIHAEPGIQTVLTDCRIEAANSVSGVVELVGANVLSLSAPSLIGLIGIPLVLLAILLDQVQRRRARLRARPFLVPPPHRFAPSSLGDRYDAR